MSATPIRVTIGDQAISGVLFDNPAANALRDLLPLDLQFRDYARQEVLADLPARLAMDGMPAGCDPEIADIGYNHGNQVVVFHYSKIGYFAGTAVLGHLDVEVSVFQGWNDAKHARIELTG